MKQTLEANKMGLSKFDQFKISPQEMRTISGGEPLTIGTVLIGGVLVVGAFGTGVAIGYGTWQLGVWLAS
jgi:hypothetical protein